MRTHTAFQVEAGLAGWLTTATALATTPLGPTPEHLSPEVTLRFTVTLGQRASGVTKFGLGVGQIQAAGNLLGPGGNPLHRREILQFDVLPRPSEPAPAMRMVLAGRMTYDFNHRVFGWHNGRVKVDSAQMVFDTPAQRPLTAAAHGLEGCCYQSKPLVLRPPEDLLIRLRTVRGAVSSSATVALAR